MEVRAVFREPPMKDSLATTGPGTAALERPTPTACRLVEASISPNTRRAYAGGLHDAGRAASSVATAVAAARFRARLPGHAGHPEGRSAAEDGGAVDAPGVRRLFRAFHGGRGDVFGRAKLPGRLHDDHLAL